MCDVGADEWIVVAISDGLFVLLGTGGPEEVVLVPRHNTKQLIREEVFECDIEAFGALMQHLWDLYRHQGFPASGRRFVEFQTGSCNRAKGAWQLATFSISRGKRPGWAVIEAFPHEQGTRVLFWDDWCIVWSEDSGAPLGPIGTAFEEFAETVVQEARQLKGERTPSRDESSGLPKGFPKKAETRELHRRVYQVCKDLQSRYRDASEFPPTLSDHREAIIEDLGKQYSIRTISSILRWGDDGLYDRFKP